MGVKVSCMQGSGSNTTHLAAQQRLGTGRLSANRQRVKDVDGQDWKRHVLVVDIHSSVGCQAPRHDKQEGATRHVNLAPGTPARSSM